MYDENGSTLLKTGYRDRLITIPKRQRKRPLINTTEALLFFFMSTEYLKTASTACNVINGISKEIVV